ncbi:DUF4147 domain-containing protein [bacterium]|nr:DUF4147 domain-containing protein [bacterium]
MSDLIQELNLQDQGKEILFRLMDDIHVGKIQESMIYLDSTTLQIGDKSYKSDQFTGVFVVAIGQAAPLMAEFVHNQLLNNSYKHDIQGLVFTDRPVDPEIEAFEYYDNQCSFVETLMDSPSHHLVCSIESYSSMGYHIVALLSDGASTLLKLPENGVSLSDNIELNKLVMRAGISLANIEIIKSHVSKVKSGKFVKFLNQHKASIFRMSQEIMDTQISKGICTTDETTYKDAMNILRDHDLDSKVPASILKVLKDGINLQIVDTLKANEIDSLNICYLNLETIKTALNNIDFVLENNGTQVFVDHSDFDQDMSEAVEICFEKLILTPVRADARSVCFVFHGQLKLDQELGENQGKCQHFCLQLGTRMLKSGFKNFELIVLSSDGIDGDSKVSGAFINEAMFLSESDKESAEECLDAFNAHEFFKSHHGLLKLGPTGAATEDLVFLICQRVKKHG